MKIRILRRTALDNQPLRVGDVVEIADISADTLIRMGRAEKVQDVEVHSPTPFRKPRQKRS